MNSKALSVYALAVAVTGAGLPAVALASEDLTPRPQRVFTEKPRIEDYDDYSAFLVEIMEYRRQKEERERAAAAAPPVEPESPLARDPYVVTRPESLEEALERARYIRHPVYDTLLRYDRTTSQSFPLEPLPSPDMSQAELEGRLADPASGKLAIFEDETARARAEDAIAGTAAEEEQRRETQASIESFAISAADYDPNSKYAVDSDGKRYYMQIANEYTSNQTTDIVLRYLFVDIEVEPLR